MKERIKLLHSELRMVKKQRDRVKEKLNGLIEAHGIALDSDMHANFKHIMQEESTAFLQNQSATNFQRIFWKQQMDAATMKDARGMRWHPLMIRFCIFLRQQSQSAYETLRASKCINLPSQRTLRDYTHHTKASPGFSSEVDSQLCNAARIEESEERDKYVLLLIDEMHIKEDLVFDKHTGNT